MMMAMVVRDDEDFHCSVDGNGDVNVDYRQVLANSYQELFWDIFFFRLEWLDFFVVVWFHVTYIYIVEFFFSIDTSASKWGEYICNSLVHSLSHIVIKL